MQDTVLVSIITPSLNQSSFVRRTLESVMAQDYPKIQHIIVDGGSSDGTVEIIREYALRHSDSVEWLSESDNGQAAAINKGFAMADGDIVAWLNSDDAYLTRNTFSEVVEVFKRNPRVDVIYGDVVLVDVSDLVLRVQCTPEFSYSRLTRQCYIFQPAAFFRRRVCEAEKLDETLFCALDYEYWLRLGQKYTFMHVPRLWSVDRNHPARKILSERDKLIQERHRLTRFYARQSTLPLPIQRLGDKMTYGLSTRVRGLAGLLHLCRLDREDLALPLRFDSMLAMIRRQLLRRNREVQ